MTCSLFSLHSDIFCKMSLSAIDISAVTRVLKSCKSVCALNLILFSFTSFHLLGSNLFMWIFWTANSLLDSLFDNVFTCQILISFSFSSSETSHIKCTWMSSAVFRDVIIVSLAIRRGPNVRTDVWMWNSVLLRNYIFRCGKSCCADNAVIIIFMFPVVGFKTVFETILWQFERVCHIPETYRLGWSASTSSNLFSVERSMVNICPRIMYKAGPASFCHPS
jgi:hypothetical protein